MFGRRQLGESSEKEFTERLTKVEAQFAAILDGIVNLTNLGVALMSTVDDLVKQAQDTELALDALKQAMQNIPTVVAGAVTAALANTANSTEDAVIAQVVAELKAHTDSALAAMPAAPIAADPAATSTATSGASLPGTGATAA